MMRIKMQGFAEPPSEWRSSFFAVCGKWAPYLEICLGWNMAIVGREHGQLCLYGGVAEVPKPKPDHDFQFPEGISWIGEVCSRELGAPLILLERHFSRILERHFPPRWKSHFSRCGFNTSRES